VTQHGRRTGHELDTKRQDSRLTSERLDFPRFICHHRDMIPDRGSAQQWS